MQADDLESLQSTQPAKLSEAVGDFSFEAPWLRLAFAVGTSDRTEFCDGLFS